MHLLPLAETPLHRIWQRRVRKGVDKRKHLGQRQAMGSDITPPGISFSNRVEVVNVAIDIGDDDGIMYRL
jgi:hypothetical protein